MAARGPLTLALQDRDQWRSSLFGQIQSAPQLEQTSKQPFSVRVKLRRIEIERGLMIE